MWRYMVLLIVPLAAITQAKYYPAEEDNNGDKYGTKEVKGVFEVPELKDSYTTSDKGDHGSDSGKSHGVPLEPGFKEIYQPAHSDSFYTFKTTANHKSAASNGGYNPDKTAYGEYVKDTSDYDEKRDYKKAQDDVYQDSKSQKTTGYGEETPSKNEYYHEAPGKKYAHVSEYKERQNEYSGSDGKGVHESDYKNQRTEYGSSKKSQRSDYGNDEQEQPTKDYREPPNSDNYKKTQQSGEYYGEQNFRSHYDEPQESNNDYSNLLKSENDYQETQKFSNDYKEPSKYGNDYKESSKYGNDYKEPSKYDNEYKEPSKFSNDYKEPSKYGNDYKEPSKYDNDYKEPSKFSNDYKEPSKFSNDYKEPSKYDNDYKEPSKYDNDYKEPSKYDNDYKEPSKYDNDYKEPSKYDNDYKEPSKYDNDYKEPSKYDNDYKEPSKYDNDYKEPSKYDNDYKEPQKYGKDYKPSKSSNDYKEPPKYGNDNKEPQKYGKDYKHSKSSHDYKEPPKYGNDYKEPQKYGKDYKHSKSSHDYKEPPKYGNDYKEPPKYGNDYKEPPKYGNDYKEPPKYGNDYKEPQKYGKDYKHSKSSHDYKEPPKYGNDYKEPQKYGKDYKHSKSSHDYKEPPKYGNDYMEPQKYGKDYMPSKSSNDYKEPQEYGNDYKEPQKYGKDYKPSKFDSDYEEPRKSGNGYREPQQHSNNEPKYSGYDDGEQEYGHEQEFRNDYRESQKSDYRRSFEGSGNDYKADNRQRHKTGYGQETETSVYDNDYRQETQTSGYGSDDRRRAQAPGYRNDYIQEATTPGYGSDYGQEATTFGYETDYKRQDQAPGYRNDYRQEATTPGYGSDYRQEETTFGYETDYKRQDQAPGYRNDYGQEATTPGYGSDYRQELHRSDYRHEETEFEYETDYPRRAQQSGNYREYENPRSSNSFRSSKDPQKSRSGFRDTQRSYGNDYQSEDSRRTPYEANYGELRRAEYGGDFGEPRRTTHGGDYGEPRRTTYGDDYGEPKRTTYGGDYGEPRRTAYGGDYGEPRRTTYGGDYGEPRTTYGGDYGEPRRTTYGGDYGEPRTTYGGDYGEPRRTEYGRGYDELRRGSHGDRFDSRSKFDDQRGSFRDDFGFNDRRRPKHPSEDRATLYKVIHDSLLNKAITESVNTVERSVKGIRRLAHLAGVTLDKKSESYRYATLHQASNISRKISDFALVSEKVSKLLVEYSKISPSELPNIDLYGTYLADGCPLEDYDPPCRVEEFRSLNGTCNNVQHRAWGAANVAFRRFIQPYYSDDVSKPRRYGRYEVLPDVRLVSETLTDILKHSDDSIKTVKHHYVSQVFVSFASFVFLDLSHIARATGHDGYYIKCCDIANEQKDHECFAALPTRDDEYCMEYVRSASAPHPHCKLGRREQMNQATSYLDASPIYGVSEAELYKIRVKNSYNLTKSAVHHLPVPEDVKRIADLFVWEHNRIAEELNRMNYNWDFEKVFQEARKIVIASLQHITYSEFLPILLGRNVIKRFDLKLAYNDYYNGYDADAYAGISNAAGVVMNSLSVLSEIKIGQTKKKPFSHKNMIHLHAKGIYASKKLQYTKKENFDGLALAVLQGRDHGLAGYQHWRKFCNLTTFSRYAELNNVIDRDILIKLIKIYGKLDDIELVIAGLTEEPEKGALLGPTFACILGLSFSKIRDADRYWYENDLPPSAFKLKQLKEVRKSSLSKLFCLHAKVKAIQPNVFLVPDKFRNAEVYCNSKQMDNVNISKFQSDSYSDKVLEETLDYLFHHVVRKTPHVYKDHRRGDSSGVRILHNFLKPSNGSFHQNTRAHKLEDVTWEFIKTHKDDQKDGLLKLISKVQVEEYLHKLSSPADYEGLCLLEEWKMDSPCDFTSSFRTYSGRCNNLHYPEYGMSQRIYARLRPPVYADHFKAPRNFDKHQNFLPSARKISNAIHHDTMIESDRYTLLLMQFGQFIDHDLGHAPLSSGHYNEPLDCSSCYSNETVSEECFPIPIPKDDPYFPPKHSISYEPRCLSFTRSMAGQKQLGHREQLNQVTSYLDLSTVYGSDECTARELRSFRRGLLKVAPYSRRGQDFLPRSDKDRDCKTRSKRCFLAGDLRCNEHPGIAVLHTIFLRFHNNIVKTLGHYNKHWDDERLFQEARKIAIAVFQKIVYDEFLPALLGNHAMYRFGLKLEECEYYKNYDKHCDATITNEFANAGFRCGHSLIKPVLPRYAHDYHEKLSSIHLRDHFFNPEVITKDKTLDEMIRGFIHVKAENVDHSLSSEVTDHLFEDKDVKYSGLDLAALNIQRGRDHGLGSYVTYVDKLHYKKPVKNFNQLTKVFDKDVVHKLKKLYKSVEDIDLFTGGLLEKPLPGGIVGPTQGKIIAKQFQNLRKCDRFWFETDDVRIRFTEDQLHEIRKMTLAKLLCDTTDISKLQEYVFEMKDDFRNPKMKCDHIDGIDFSKWHDFDSCSVGDVVIPAGSSAPASPCTHCTCTSEGVMCRSVRVNNCHHILKLYGVEIVRKDDVCVSQCPLFALYSSSHRLNRHKDEDDRKSGNYGDRNDYEDDYHTDASHCSPYDQSCTYDRH